MFSIMCFIIGNSMAFALHKRSLGEDCLDRRMATFGKLHGVVAFSIPTLEIPIPDWGSYFAEDLDYHIPFLLTLWKSASTIIYSI